MRVGMRRDQRRIAQRRDIPKTFFIEMRQVDHDAQPIADADQRFAEVGQAGAGIGRRRTAERHAVAEHIRPAPHRAERAQPRRVEHVEQIEIRIDRFGAFDMQHRRQYVIGNRTLDIAGGAAETNAALGLPLDP